MKITKQIEIELTATDLVNAKMLNRKFNREELIVFATENVQENGSGYFQAARIMEDVDEETYNEMLLQAVHECTLVFSKEFTVEDFTGVFVSKQLEVPNQ